MKCSLTQEEAVACFDYSQERQTEDNLCFFHVYLSCAIASLLEFTEGEVRGWPFGGSELSDALAALEPIARKLDLYIYNERLAKRE